MKHQQSGFTLVDLTVVMMILGIVAASALPRLINLTNDARVVTVEGLSSGLRSAIGLLQAENIATDHDKPTTPYGTAVTFRPPPSGENTTCQAGDKGKTGVVTSVTIGC